MDRAAFVERTIPRRSFTAFCRRRTGTVIIMIASDHLNEYLSLISPVHQEKPRLMALASAVLSQAGDLFSL